LGLPLAGDRRRTLHRPRPGHPPDGFGQGKLPLGPDFPLQVSVGLLLLGRRVVAHGWYPVTPALVQPREPKLSPPKGILSRRDRLSPPAPPRNPVSRPPAPSPATSSLGSSTVAGALSRNS